ncbi:40S ribosomal protein [Zychaea mexicana]|uniref:40S ribosomal protein n=1 Tax=Zychaea mexicana TaxID=64656 RepID=UPI0022FE4318|nr:40S ribosomal protein [Zychaea mexicana]KAI9490007.1 40S ribosomal protein [Zychaea mexicana]
MDIQTEKAYQKQHGIFQNSKNASKRNKRWVKDVGHGFKTPNEAKYGNYVDKKCPWAGEVNIQGRILTGVVISNKMKRTIVLRRDYLHYVPKYNRYEKRHTNISAHLSPAFDNLAVGNGDIVTVGQCRPLSKTIRFNVLKVQKAKSASKQFTKF